MKKIEDINMEEIKNVFKQARREDTFNFDGFEEGYCRYFGCGTHLYIFADNCYDKIEEIGSQQINPRFMAEQMAKITDKFRVVMLDFEMGDMSVWGNK